MQGLDISRGFNLVNETDFTSKYTEKSGAIFWFSISREFIFAKNLKICNITTFYTRKNIATWEKGVRISILFGEDTPSAVPVSVRKTTFTSKLKFWSPPPHLKAMGPLQ